MLISQATPNVHNLLWRRKLHQDAAHTHHHPGLALALWSPRGSIDSSANTAEAPAVPGDGPKDFYEKARKEQEKAFKEAEKWNKEMRERQQKERERARETAQGVGEAVSWPRKYDSLNVVWSP